MDLKDLTREQIEKAKACAGTDELVAFIKEEGIELSDDELDKVAGGDFEWSEAIPKNYFA